MDKWEKPLKAKTPGDVYWQMILYMEKNVFMSMLTKEAQRGLVQSLVEHLLVEEENDA